MEQPTTTQTHQQDEMKQKLPTNITMNFEMVVLCDYGVPCGIFPSVCHSELSKVIYSAVVLSNYGFYVLVTVQ